MNAALLQGMQPLTKVSEQDRKQLPTDHEASRFRSGRSEKEPISQVKVTIKRAPSQTPRVAESNPLRPGWPRAIDCGCASLRSLHAHLQPVNVLARRDEEKPAVFSAESDV